MIINQIIYLLYAAVGTIVKKITIVRIDVNNFTNG